MIRPLYNKIHHLAECPIWNAEDMALYWTDILNGEIWRYDVQTGKTRLYWKGKMLVGGFAFTPEGDIILCSDKGIFRLSKSVKVQLAAKPELLFNIPFDAGERFNDITTDPSGRILAGTKRNDLKNGKLYMIERGKSPEIILKNIHISNGMTFSMDKKYFYHTDSRPCTITRYRYDHGTGHISSPEIFYQGNSSSGFPDGITLDSMDCLWVAFWGASCVRRISTDGKVMEEIMIPAIQPSSVMIGGENMKELYITTACEGGTDISKGLDKKGNYLGGKVYQTSIPVKGRLEWKALF